MERTRFRPRNGRSSSIASANPSTIEPTTAAPVKTAVLNTIWRVSDRVNHSV
ncbi:Uncharacterised protein [Mycobacterium tuberculosis]|uniref:Uncharacterized protein n=1 Tax=Mycobacterium tuberculosis TaxID=1773 RepID=A0A655JRS9_MYCTX|nr:Uncharacterised protein [Mycobacterium tuberculosis]COY08355.1 Uncharacterised protein [Mycobacterium tuberculosis]